MKTTISSQFKNQFICSLLFVFLFAGGCVDPHPKSDAISNIETNSPSPAPVTEFKLSDGMSISANKMNVLYIGVENPITINAAGVSSNSLKVSVTGGGGKIKYIRPNQYSVIFTRPTGTGQECEIKVSANGFEKTEKFRVKRIPDPMAMVSLSKGGSMGVGEFKAQGGVLASLENFDFDAKCKVQGFMLSYIPRGKTALEVVNRGARYSGETKELIDAAKPGDIYTYSNVKAKCPGDVAGRKINSMVFLIK